VTDAIGIHLRDLGQPLVDAWTHAFAGVESVTTSCGDIFSSEPGVVPTDAPIDIQADAIVSPANSYGFMDGGIDAVYTYEFGEGLQRRLQEVLAADYHGELPVGQAVIIPTDHDVIPWCISAPTMRIPGGVSETVNAYLAFRAAARAVLAHNASGLPRIRTVLCPGLATAIGRMPVQRCARQMRAAWDQVFGESRPFPRSLAAAAQHEANLLA